MLKLNKGQKICGYSANGLNLKDVVLLKFSAVKEGFIEVIRQKTRTNRQSEKITIRIPYTDELKQIIQRWGNTPSNKDIYIFPMLSKFTSPSELDIFCTSHQTIKNVNKYMKKIAKTLELSRLPTSNFARHTFATVMKNSGAPLAMISGQLGHSKLSTTQIYFSEFEDEQLIDTTKYLTAFKTEK